MSKPKKYVVGRVGKAPTLTRIEILTQGLMRDPNEVKASFSIKEDEKGRGVYLKIPELPKGSFVLEYEGDIINLQEVKRREKVYASNGEGCFIMEFQFSETKMAIDATRNFDSYTRLLNHSRDPNIRFHAPIVVNLDGPPKPRIAAYALRDIKRGEEIVFDYGVKDRMIPWLKNRKIGYAEVSDDEYEEEDDVDNDKGSCSSEENYLCLRHTAARAGRLDGEDKPAFNYREYSRSDSSSSDSGKESSRHYRSKSKHNRSSLSNSDNQSTSTSSPKSSLYHPGTRECRWEFKTTGKRKYQVSFGSIAQPQKILKCLEPKRKSRKTDCSGSIICLSDESSPSQESISDGNPEELLDIPEVSSQAKVLDWQESFCSDESDCNIKIVGVQSLCDSPEHVSGSEPPYQTANPIASQSCQPVVSLERLDCNTALKRTGPPTESVSPRRRSSTNFAEASPNMYQSHPTAQEILPTASVSNHLLPTSPPLQQGNDAMQDVPLQASPFVPKPLSSTTALKSDLSIPSTGSNKVELSKPAQKPESPLTISDSEDQPLCRTISTIEKVQSHFQSDKTAPSLYSSSRKSVSQESGKVAPNVLYTAKASTSHSPHYIPPNEPPKKLTQIPENCMAQSQENLCLGQTQMDSQHISKDSIFINHSSLKSSQSSPQPNHFQSGNHHLMSQQSQTRCVGRKIENTPPSTKNHIQQKSQVNNFKRANNLFHENHSPENRQKSLANHVSCRNQPESLVISDEDDEAQGMKTNQGKSSGTTATATNHSQSKGQIVLIPSSGDDSDVEEVAPSKALFQPSRTQNYLNNSTAKGISLSSNPNASTLPRIEDSGCELIHVEQAKQNTSKMVAVIQPFKSDVIDSNECSSPSNEVLTYAEKDHLCKIFDRSSFSRNVSKQDINDKIYRHWGFFRSILERGVSIEQIRAAVKQTCLEKYKRSYKRRINSSKNSTGV